MARRAHQARRKRQVQAGIAGAVALIVVVFGATWLLGGFESDPEPVTLPTCTWTAKDATADAGVTDTGLPPTSGEARSGTDVLTIRTDLGDIVASMDLTKVPCTAASLKFLGEKGFYDGGACSVLDTEAKTLTCGDPKGDGTGTPAYQFPDENIPAAPVGTASPSTSASPSEIPSYYSKGTVVMANKGPNSNAGQFFIVYGDGSNLKAEYSIVGTVVSGLDIVEGIAAGGAVDGNGAPATTGKPSKTLTIKQLYVGTAPAAPAATASATPSST